MIDQFVGESIREVARMTVRYGMSESEAGKFIRQHLHHLGIADGYDRKHAVQIASFARRIARKDNNRGRWVGAEYSSAEGPPRLTSRGDLPAQFR